MEHLINFKKRISPNQYKGIHAISFFGGTYNAFEFFKLIYLLKDNLFKFNRSKYYIFNHTVKS